MESEYRTLPGPNPPILDSIETSASDATISYFPPDGQDISYYIGKIFEYFSPDTKQQRFWDLLFVFHDRYSMKLTLMELLFPKLELKVVESKRIDSIYRIIIRKLIKKPFLTSIS